ncbi:MAG: hypothetical protein HND44_08720 [Chloroflexi bacterium]|nr:hypothetical protein [Ardenticatenaceae bacterium]MBL1128563.1 hypothetical protein [Chloroflexota bacterium]NOG34642.1 hypothetical protein [Chloroflexota bacterium]GIK56722.1 MAG: hypothetical protein BroJett015_23850 [Chloroflexota bacterium]
MTYTDGRAGENSNSLATTQIYPVSENGRLLENAQPETLYSQPDPASCETDTLQASPNGMYMILSYNCEANYYARIVHTSDSNSEPILLPRGVFLDWSPDGAWFLFRDTDEDVIWLVDLLY